MKQQTIIRDGFISKGNAEITGSIIVSAGITGSLFGTASFASTAGAVIGSVTNAISASYVAGGNVDGAVGNSTRLNNQAASYYTNASNINAGTLENSYLPTSINITSFTGSLKGTATTASYVLNAVSASTSTQALSSSFTLTASFIDGGFY